MSAPRHAVLKLHILSDIHLEFGKWQRDVDVNAIDADVTILAGDIGVGLDGLRFAMELNRPVIYVMGNHEYYGQRPMVKLWEKARTKVAGTNVHLLEDEAVVINGVRFLGCTLWTDFLLFGEEQRDALMQKAQADMNDFSAIHITQRLAMHHDSGSLGQVHRHRGDTWTPQRAAEKHAKSRAFLEAALAQRTGPDWDRTVVVTHHAPSALSLSAKKPVFPLDVAYASHLDALVEQADLWVHGHTHIPVNYLVGGGRVVSNPRGYLRVDEVWNFNPKLVVEV